MKSLNACPAANYRRGIRLIRPFVDGPPWRAIRLELEAFCQGKALVFLNPVGK